MSVSLKMHPPEIRGLFVADPNASRHDKPIYVDEVTSGLAAVTRGAAEAQRQKHDLAAAKVLALTTEVSHG